MNYNGQRAPKLNSKKKASALTRRTFLMFCAFSILVSLWIANDYQQPYLYQDLYQNFLLPTFDDEKNSEDVKEWRGATEKLCQAIVEQPSNSYDLRVQAKEVLEVEALKRFELPGHGNMRGENLVEHKKYEKCRHAFIDLGTNIGDSIGYFVDGALDVCTPIWKRKFPRTRINEQFPHPHLDVADLKIQNKGIGVNPLMGMMRKYMTGVTPMLPENTCVYGMEGNPEFTERLKKLENFIMEMKPRPVRHLHIHTETVVTEDDKPTKLFLDKTSVKDNVSHHHIVVFKPQLMYINHAFALVLGIQHLEQSARCSQDCQGTKWWSINHSGRPRYSPDDTSKERNASIPSRRNCR